MSDSLESLTYGPSRLSASLTVTIPLAYGKPSQLLFLLDGFLHLQGWSWLLNPPFSLPSLVALSLRPSSQMSMWN